MNYTKKRNAIVVAIIFLAGILTGGRILAPKVTQIFSSDEIYTVTEVIDGDTFRIDPKTRVRVMGINSPEKGECYYLEAKEALKNLIEGKVVKLEKDITDKDRYGRLLRYATLLVEEGDNVLVNDYMVRNGFAFNYPIPPDKHYRDLFNTAEEIAKRENLGMWAECDYEENDDSDKREVDSGPSDPNCIIKGNISEKGFGMTYLVPGCDNYKSVKIDTRKGEKYFCTEKEAIAAGFRKATNCP